MKFAEVVPVIADLAVDGANRIWIRRAGPHPGRGGPTDIVTTAGEYVGTIATAFAMPAAFGPGSRIAYIRTDDLGVQSVEIGRVTLRAGSGTQSEAAAGS